MATENKEKRIYDLIEEKKDLLRFLLEMNKTGRLTLVANEQIAIEKQINYPEYSKFVIKYRQNDSIYQTIKTSLEARLEEIQKEIDDILNAPQDDKPVEER